MTDDDLARLEALTDAAPSGPWEFCVERDTGALEIRHSVAPFVVARNIGNHTAARYIAAMHPGQAKALIAEIRRLRNEPWGPSVMEKIMPLQMERDRLAAEVAELRDRAHADTAEISSMGHDIATLRAQLDEARKQAEHHKQQLVERTLATETKCPVCGVYDGPCPECGATKEGGER